MATTQHKNVTKSNQQERFYEKHHQDCVSSASAGDSRAASCGPEPAHHAIDAGYRPDHQDRKENQQDRIASGVKSGELTAGETTNLEKKESDINQEERDMRKLDNGKLTTADKDTLNQQQNQLSKQIYQGQAQLPRCRTPNPKSEVGKREENQQDRIAQGIKSGQLTAGEAAHLENNEAKINNEVRNDRAANGGKLTPQEKTAGQPPAEPPVASDLSRQAQRPPPVS